MRAFLTESVTVATDKKDVFDRVIGLIKMFGDRRRISKVAIVENGTQWNGDAPQSVCGDGAWSPQCTVCGIFCIQ